MSETASVDYKSVSLPPNLSGLRPWKAGQSGNPGGRPKTNPAILEETHALLECVTPKAARFHVELIEMALAIFEQCKKDKELPNKNEASLIATAEKSCEIVFNRILGKVESTLNVKNDIGAEAFVRAFRALLAPVAPVVLEAELVKPNVDKGHTDLLPVADIHTGSSTGDALPLPNPQQLSIPLSQPEQLKP